jgi:glycosyltransferase involved in cell wall biosynthesis
MTQPDVSVVMPVRNAAETLESALASVLASSSVELELICIDDGSDDASGKLLDEEAARDQRLRVIHTPPRGIVPALNLGLERARAPLVARMDADDEVLPERLSAQAEHLERHPQHCLVGCQVECFRRGGLGEGSEEIERQVFVECPVPHPTWTFRRDVIRELGGYRELGWPEDLDLLYRILESGAGVGKLGQVLHRWRDHPRRVSRVSPVYGREAFARVKAHFLPRLHPMPAAVVWGAGRTGRRLVRLLQAEGVPTRALLDVNPRRIGTTWMGIPVFSPDRLTTRMASWRDEGLRLLVAVASRGARDEIRAQLHARSLREGEDFLVVA